MRAASRKTPFVSCLVCVFSGVLGANACDDDTRSFFPSALLCFLGGGGEKEEALTPCCDARAACVQICGMSVKSCDDAFDVCMDSTCASLAEPEAEECEKNKKMHKLMLNLGGGGCDKYTAGQSGSCQCMEPARASV